MEISSVTKYFTNFKNYRVVEVPNEYNDESTFYVEKYSFMILGWDKVAAFTTFEEAKHKVYQIRKHGLKETKIHHV